MVASEIAAEVLRVSLESPKVTFTFLVTWLKVIVSLPPPIPMEPESVAADWVRMSSPSYELTVYLPLATDSAPVSPFEVPTNVAVLPEVVIV